MPMRSNRSNEAESSNTSSLQGSFPITQPDLENLALESQGEERYNYTIEYFTNAINEQPTAARYYFLRGHCHFELRNYREAVRDFKQALKFDPTNEEYRFRLTHILSMYIGIDHEDIEEIFSLMNDTELAALGDEFFAYQQYGNAARCYTEALNREPLKRWYEKRGRCHMQQRDFEKAILDFIMVLEDNPPNAKNTNTALLRQALFSYPRFLDLPRKKLGVLPFEELVELANSFKSSGSFEEALCCYNEAIKKRPHDKKCYKQHGKLCLKIGKTTNVAINDFLQVAKIDPNDEENWITLAHLLYESGKSKELIEYTRDLRNINDLLELGDLFSSKGMWKEAIRCYTEAIKKERNNPEPFKRRGHLYWIIDVPNMAILDFVDAARLQPVDEEIWNSLSRILIDGGRMNELIEYAFLLADVAQLSILGDTFCDMGKFDEAFRCYNEAIRREPKDAEFYRRRAICHFKMKNLDEAMLDSILAMELNPERRENWDLFSRSLLNEGKFEDLVKYALQLTSSDEIIRLCEKLHSLEKFDEALHCYSEALEKKPHDPNIYKSRGCFYMMKMKNYNLARADFVMAAELHIRNRKNLGGLSQLLLESEAFGELIKCTLRVDDEDELAKLGDQFYSFGKFEETFQCYTEGLNKYPQRALYHYKLGWYHWQIQNLEQALPYLKRAVKMEPSNVGYRLDFIKVLDEAGEYGAEAKKAFVRCADLRDIGKEDEVWLERMNEKMEMKRLDELMKYLRELIVKDANRRINAIRQESLVTSGTDIESDNKITEVELHRDRCLEQLERAYSKYTPEKIFPRLTQVPLWKIPEYLTDKITYELMEDPVITPSGITYERMELMTHLHLNDNNDPISRQPLEVNQLRPNFAIKKIIESWKKNTTESNLGTNL